MNELEEMAKLELIRYIYGKQLSTNDIKDYISILFGLITKQQKEIKELQDEYLIQRDLINPDFMKDYISKDKIKEKIEELERQEDWYREHNSLEDLYGRIEDLKKIIEE